VRRRETSEAEEGRAARLGALIVRHPREFVGFVLATIATGWIFTNALVLQKGPHPAPFFAAPLKHASAPARPAASAPAAAAASAVRHVEPASLPMATPARRNDPIAALLAPTPKLFAVQQALTEFGYGPVAPTGVFDPQTHAAIVRFEETRGLPVDGQLSERFMRELSKVAGRAID
jgi:Putative peptidoglycan binding domain